MANNEIKTNAEIYREQRKARLAKAAKKKKSGKGDKVIRILVKILVIILAVAVLLFGAYRLLADVFCVPQRIITAATYGDEKITVAEYNHYYMQLFEQAVNVSQQYDSSYGTGAGAQYYFDPSVDPAEQDYPGDDAPEGVTTWADYFKHFATERAFLIKSIYNKAISEEAKKEGFELTEAQQTEMDETIQANLDEYIESAEKGDFALSNYLFVARGEGITEKLYKELLERDSLSQYYLDWYQKKAQAEISDDEINEYYEKHRDEIDIAGFRYFTVSYAEAVEGSTDPVYTQAEAKARAEQFKAKATTEKDFIAAAKEFAPPSYADAYAEDSATLAEDLTKANITSLSEDFANWVFDSARKAGEMNIFEVESQEAFYVVLMTTPAHKDTSTAGADVRHLLVQAETSTTNDAGETITLSNDEIAANFDAAKKEAEKLLKEWKDGEATEKSFSALVTEHTDDTASAETGGLYEDITSQSNYVPEFLEWSLAPHKAGDTGIVKTDYGYHIMYYVGADSQQKWQSDISAILSSDDYNAYTEELYNEISEGIERNEFFINWTVKSCEEIVKTYTANFSSAASSYTY